MARPDAALITNSPAEVIHMLHKTALFVASVAAALTLAFALSAAGFAPGATPTAEAATVNADAAGASAPPTVQVDKVYIAAPKPQRTITVHKVLKTAGGESEGSEGDD